MDAWNTYAEWDEARCLARIGLLQDQISAGANQITSPGGGAGFQTPDQARYTIWELRCRVAQIRGTPRPPPPPKVDRNRLTMRWARVDFDGGY